LDQHSHGPIPIFEVGHEAFVELAGEDDATVTRPAGLQGEYQDRQPIGAHAHSRPVITAAGRTPLTSLDQAAGARRGLLPRSGRPRPRHGLVPWTRPTDCPSGAGMLFWRP